VIATDAAARYELTSADEGVLFDIDGDGTREKVAWPVRGSSVAFLSLDRDGDGRISSGAELVSEMTHAGSRNAFQALAELVKAEHGVESRGNVSARDALFDRLLLWSDANADGMSEPAELERVTERLATIGLGYGKLFVGDRYGNRYEFQGFARVRTAPGENDSHSPLEDEPRMRSIYTVRLTMD
jgi:hypothetical protein